MRSSATPLKKTRSKAAKPKIRKTVLRRISGAHAYCIQNGRGSTEPPAPQALALLATAGDHGFGGRRAEVDRSDSREIQDLRERIGGNLVVVAVEIPDVV